MISDLLTSKKEKKYIENGSIAKKVIKIKLNNDKYLKLKEDKKTIQTTDNSNDASIFSLYIYEYGFDINEEFGATKRTFAIKCLDNNKYLTIQNYFSKGDSKKNYYNVLDNNKEIYEIQANSEIVSWNERFYIENYDYSDEYIILSHLDTLRDDPCFKITPIYITDYGLYCDKTQNNICKFKFENVKGYEQLEIRQSVSETGVKVYWKPINGDNDISHYTVNNYTVNYDNNMMYIYIKDLPIGNYNIEVKYNFEDNEQKSLVNIRRFNHPGIAHTENELDLMKEHISEKLEPWYSDYYKLLHTVPDKMSSHEYIPKFHVGVGRGNPIGYGNILDFEQSANAAYFNALQWVITDDNKYAETVINILNGWASELKIVDGRDRILGAAISGYRLNNAAEIVRYYKGGYIKYTNNDFIKYQEMMENVIYPVIQDFGLPMVANGNWDVAAIMTLISIGVLCDNTEIFNRAVNAYQDIHVNGSIDAYVSEWGQSVESARDQAHAQLGIGYMSDICKVALSQNVNLYELYDNRLAKAFNWAAKYNLTGKFDKFKPLDNIFGKKDELSYWSKMDKQQINRGELRPIYEVPLAYYSKVEGVDVTWMKRAAEAMRAEGYVHNDNLNFSTLTTYNGKVITELSEPCFKLRTTLKPWYQLTWDLVDEYGDNENEEVYETLNSYFDINENKELVASKKKDLAPYYQLKNNNDGTYSIKCLKNNKYLSIKDEIINNQNIVRVDAKEIGENEKFILNGTGYNRYYFKVPKYNNRIINVDITKGEDELKNFNLTIRLGEDRDLNDDSSLENKLFIIMFNKLESKMK